MSTLLLKNLNTLITCDDADQILHNVDVYCEDGWIRAMGEHLPQTADTVIDGAHYWCYPGLVNTHHPQSAAGAEYGAVRLADDPV